MTKLIAVNTQTMNCPIRASAFALEYSEHLADFGAEPSHCRLGNSLLIGHSRSLVSPVEIAL